MIPLFLFCLGASIGSFLNVCIWRLPRGESVVYPPSHCPNCNTQLKGVDLVPLLSQLILGARCRYCKTKFSWRYFGIELLTGLLFLLVALRPGNLEGNGFMAAWVGDPARLARDLIFMATLVVVFFVDYDTRLIQLESVFLLGLAGVSYDAWRLYKQEATLTDGVWLQPWLPAPLPESVLAMVVTAALLWVVREGFSWYYQREALGFGDVILVAAIAATLGWNATLLTFFFLAVMLGATIGVALQIPRAVRSYKWGKIRSRKYGGQNLARALARHAFRKAMPFGPMLAIGAVAALLYGPQLNHSYMELLNGPMEPGFGSATQLPGLVAPPTFVPPPGFSSPR